MQNFAKEYYFKLKNKIMTLKQLKQRYEGHTFVSHGHFRVCFKIYNKSYCCITTNTLAIDRIDDDLPERTPNKFYVTQKQALEALYKEVKSHNF